MIPQAAITAWRTIAPWNNSDQVEHDLILSRAICELYANPLIRESLVFRGGTALHKLFFNNAGRFSEDLDFVQVRAEPIGATIHAVRQCLDEWLGSPSWKQNHGRFTLYYRFTTELEPVVNRKVKIEINTREHFNVEPYITKEFSINNQWFTGKSNVLSYSIEELLATKLRALYQRKKGRDLYDFWHATHNINNLDIDNIITIFSKYMKAEDSQVSRAEFEKNLFLKQQSKGFNNDISPLLAAEQLNSYSTEEAYEILFKQFLINLPGNSWKNLSSEQ